MSSPTDPLSSLNGKPTMALVPPGQCQFTEEFVSVPLLERTKVSSTASVFRFGVPDTLEPLNLSTCSSILAKATMPKNLQEPDGEMEDVIRPYTPISTNALTGCFDLLIKNYGPTAKMSRHLHEMPIGDTIDFKHIPVNVKLQAPFPQSNIVMLVGGTGITPMIQALHAILGDPEPKQSKVIMIYGSQKVDDILGREMVDAWEKEYPDRFQVVHVLSQEPKDSDWTGERGYVDRAKCEKYMPPPSTGEELMIFMCGPPPMYNSLCGPRETKEVTGILADLGYTKEQVYKF